jgi:uncharacterized protein (DUF433 family)
MGRSKAVPVERDSERSRQSSRRAHVCSINRLVVQASEWDIRGVMDYRKIIMIEPGKRGGKPCIRGLRITVGDVLGWVAAGMSRKEIIEDFPDLTEEDIQACLEYAANREQHTTIALTPHETSV